MKKFLLSFILIQGFFSMESCLIIEEETKPEIFYHVREATSPPEQIQTWWPTIHLDKNEQNDKNEITGGSIKLNFWF